MEVRARFLVPLFSFAFSLLRREQQFSFQNNYFQIKKKVFQKTEKKINATNFSLAKKIFASRRQKVCFMLLSFKKNLFSEVLNQNFFLFCLQQQPELAFFVPLNMDLFFDIHFNIFLV